MKDKSCMKITISKLWLKTKKISKVSVFITILLTIFSNTFASEEIKIEDIENHWAKNEITLLLNEDIISGYDDNTFKPNKAVTVSEFLKIVVEMADYKLETIGEPWPNWYIQTAIKNELISENEFNNYNKEITRFEAAKIISRYIDLKDVSKSKNIFNDLDKDEQEVVLKLVKLKVINGYEDNTFRSDNSITRAEACKIIINAYNAKQELLKTRQSKLKSNLTNIKDDNETEVVNSYEIKKDRIYIYDNGRYANLNGQTLNQEYINDKLVIKILEKLVGPESYTELKFVPDKYIINNLNICYGNKISDVQNGGYIFEIRFYENAYYDVAFSKDNSDFTNNAFIKIKTGKMWDKQFEYENDISCSEKNLYKLKKVVGEILGQNLEEEFIDYFIEKRIQASKIQNSDIPKISEVKKIGKYTINTFCINNNDLEFYIQKI